MRILRADVGDYRSVSSLWTVRRGIDLGRLTILFGPNGAGKTNLLEAIARLLEYAGSPGSLRAALRQTSSPDDDGAPGLLVVELDRWQDDRSLDQRILWKLLSNPRATELFFSIHAEWSELPGPLLAEFEEVFAAFPAPCPSLAAVAHLMDLWVEVMTYAHDAGSTEDRRLLASEVIGQCTFEMPEGFPAVIGSRFSNEAREAARRIAADAEERSLPSWFDDAVGDCARHALDGGETPFAIKESMYISSLPQIGFDVFDDLAIAFGGAWVVDGAIGDLEAELADALAEMGSDSGAASDEDVALVASRLQSRANELCPSFVSDGGQIEIGARPPQIRFHEGDGERWPVDDLGAGVARWVAIATRAAIREAQVEGPDRRDGAEDRSSALGVYLIDEPEAHLHLGAVRSLREWLVRRNSEGVGAVVATHALELLDLPTQTAEFLLIQRQGEVSVAVPVGEHLLEALRRDADRLGISGADVLRLARGVLIVEGKHDEDVLRHYYGGDLAEQRIIVLRLHGVDEALALVELQYLSQLGLPLVFLCDNVRRDFLRRPTPGSDTTKEEKAVVALRALGRERQLDIVSHGLPDIICALPESAVRRVVEQAGGRFAGWKSVIAGYRRERRPMNLKDYLAPILGQAADGRFIGAVLEASQAGERPAAKLDRAMSEALARLT